MSSSKPSKYDPPAYRKVYHEDDKYYGRGRAQQSSTKYDDSYKGRSPHRDDRGRDNKHTKQPAYQKGSTYRRDDYRQEAPSRDYYDDRRYDERRAGRVERPRSRQRSKDYDRGDQYRRSRDKKRQRSNERSQDRRKSRSYSSSPRSRRKKSRSMSSRSYSESRSRSRNYKRRARSRSSSKSNSFRKYDYYSRHTKQDQRDRKEKYRQTQRRPEPYYAKNIKDGGRDNRERQQIRVQLRSDFRQQSRQPKDYYDRDYYKKIQVNAEKGENRSREPPRTKIPQTVINRQPQNITYLKQQPEAKKNIKPAESKPCLPFDIVQQQKPIRIVAQKQEKPNEDSNTQPKKKEKDPQLHATDTIRQPPPAKVANQLDELIKATQKILKFQLPQNSFLVAQSYRRMDDIEFEGALPEWKNRLQDGKSNINLLRCEWISEASNKVQKAEEASSQLIPPRHFKLQRPQYENTEYEIKVIDELSKLMELSDDIRYKSKLIGDALRKIVSIEADLDILKSHKVQ